LKYQIQDCNYKIFSLSPLLLFSFSFFTDFREKKSNKFWKTLSIPTYSLLNDQRSVVGKNFFTEEKLKKGVAFFNFFGIVCSQAPTNFFDWRVKNIETRSDVYCLTLKNVQLGKKDEKFSIQIYSFGH
jgi:hypothetical protein